MQKVRWARAAYSPFLFLLLLSVFASGCATQLTQAEKVIASGKTVKSVRSIDIVYLAPDENARKKIALAMNAINKGDFSCSAVKTTLRDIRNDLHVSHALQVEAGYLLTLMEKLEIWQKELDSLQLKNDKCDKEREDVLREKDAALDAALKEKNETISGLKRDREELEFKINKLTETYTKTAKRRKSKQ